MTTAVAEQLPSQTREVYAASMHTLRMLGAASLSGVGAEGTHTLAFDDFITKISEMLQTDEDLGRELDMMRPKRFDYEDGRTRAADGTPMADIVQRGLQASREHPDARIRMTQVERDAGDLLIARRVDELEIGKALLTASVEPKNELEGSDAKFWHERGYRKGVAYLQVYWRVSQDQMWAGTLSVRGSDPEKLREVFARHGKNIPQGVDPNHFIRHYLEFDATNVDPEMVARDFRDEYYKTAGVAVASEAIEAILDRGDNKEFVESMFEAYYPTLSRALVTGKNQPALQQFASDMLRHIPVEKFRPEVYRQLMRVANSPRFDSEMGRVLDDVIPYAAKEHIRQSIAQKIDSPDEGAKKPYLPELYSQPNTASLHPGHMQMSSMQQMAISGVMKGVTAGRGGGGCSGVNLSRENSELEIGLGQGIYGGLKEGESYPAGEDQFGPLKFKCTEGHDNERRRGQLLPECQHKPCKKGSVGCK